MRSFLSRVERLEKTVDNSSTCICHVPHKVVTIHQFGGKTDEEVQREIEALPEEVRNPPLCSVHNKEPVTLILVRGVKPRDEGAPA